MNEGVQAEMAASAKICRELSWDEMTDAQRIQAMRRIIQNQHYIIRDLQEAAKIARAHMHAPSGEVMASVKQDYNEPLGYRHRMVLE